MLVPAQSFASQDTHVSAPVALCVDGMSPTGIMFKDCIRRRTPSNVKTFSSRDTSCLSPCHHQQPSTSNLHPEIYWLKDRRIPEYLKCPPVSLRSSLKYQGPSPKLPLRLVRMRFKYLLTVTSYLIRY